MMKKNKIVYLILGVLLLSQSCSSYLDVVPDQNNTIDDFYNSKEKAYKGLSTCYNFIPALNMTEETMALAGDEFCGRLDKAYFPNDRLAGSKLMTGANNTSNPILNYWSGGNRANSLYKGITNCNVFLEKILTTPDLTYAERKDWIAQVTFLKAYYHFLLLQAYGPIVISDSYIDPSGSIDAVRQKRSSVDECFKYIVGLLDKVAGDMPEKRSGSWDGQIDNVILKALKSRVLLYAASPFYNGNIEFYNDFLDKDNQPYFNLKYDANKWKIAADAAKEAIDEATINGERAIYHFTGKPYYPVDMDMVEKSGIMKTCYDLVFTIVDQSWNNELIWGGGYNNPRITYDELQQDANPRSPTDPLATAGAANWLGASYSMLELFYSKNGVPISEDVTYDYDNRTDTITIPSDPYYLGYLQVGKITAKIHINREPRFYAWIGVDRGYWLVNSKEYALQMQMGESPGGKTSPITDFYATGIAIKKLVHPEMQPGHENRVRHYPFPYIRLAELYLNYAEALNEYSGPGPEVYKAINVIRSRAGLRNIEDVWSDPSIVKDVNKHLTKDGLRSIIQQERMIELCFEGHKYRDVLRWKRADEFFHAPITGYNSEAKGIDFYQIAVKQARFWQTPRNYLFPIPLGEMTLNPNLIQNPYW